MNDTTLPITKSTTTKKKPAVIRRTEKGIKKGFGLHDWMTLLRRSKDLAQRKGAPLRTNISLSEVQTHNKSYDGWTILRGKVYNLSPYLAYHPGGSVILESCLGKDATGLFDKYHSWVNIDNLIGPLLLGYLLVEKKKSNDDTNNAGGYLKLEGNTDGIVMPTAASTTTSNAKATVSQNDTIGFAMPKPRPPKGEPIASLLPPDNDDGEEEEEDDLLNA